MRKLNIAAQALLGLIFFVFGLNGFLNFIPTPDDLPEKVAAFMGAMVATGYFLPVLKAVETLSGLLLLIRKFPALALVLLAPIVVQILLFHIFLEPSGLPIAILVVVLEGYLGFFVYKDRFKAVLAP